MRLKLHEVAQVLGVLTPAFSRWARDNGRMRLVSGRVTYALSDVGEWLCNWRAA
jgi:hypothetical protein